ncbi:MAG: HEPN domain-containing protein [Ignavibacteria bacterium]|nr:HEPN domain-containing protein [Ignavibacteria bacterium]
MEQEVDHHYLSILRCQTWCIWPENTTIVAGKYEAKTKQYGSIELQVRVVTYAQRPRPETEPAKPTPSIGPLIWRGELTTGYLYGRAILKAPEDQIPVRFKFDYAFEGEIDIQVLARSRSELEKSEMEQLAAQIAYPLLTYLNLRHAEFLRPVAPIQCSKLEGKNRMLECETLIAVHDRKTFDVETLKDSIREALVRRINVPAERSRALYLACKRLLSADLESDPVDRYCDLWEACEFLSQFVSSKGTVPSRIATALAEFTGYAKPKLETRLGLRNLYQMRKDIVHNAVENVHEIEQQTPLLSSVVRQLISWTLGMQYSGDTKIDSLFGGGR